MYTSRYGVVLGDSRNGSVSAKKTPGARTSLIIIMVSSACEIYWAVDEFAFGPDGIMPYLVLSYLR